MLNKFACCYVTRWQSWKRRVAALYRTMKSWTAVFTTSHGWNMYVWLLLNSASEVMFLSWCACLLARLLCRVVDEFSKLFRRGRLGEIVFASSVSLAKYKTKMLWLAVVCYYDQPCLWGLLSLSTFLMYVCAAGAVEQNSSVTLIGYWLQKHFLAFILLVGWCGKVLLYPWHNLLCSVFYSKVIQPLLLWSSVSILATLPSV